VARKKVGSRPHAALMVFAFVAVTACKPRTVAKQQSADTEGELAAVEIALAPPVLNAKAFAVGEGECAEGDPLQGCLRVSQKSPSDSQSVAQSTVMLRYFWHAVPDAAKPTLLFLHGGPGGDSASYSSMSIFATLAKTHNVLFYDQRGGGQSSPLAGNGIPGEARLRHFFVAHHVADIEALRENVVKAPRIAVMGHSFGAHLALAYATTHPERTSALLALNGAADATGFVTQSTLRVRMFDRIALRTLGAAKFAKLQALGENGTLRSPDGTKADSIFSALHPLLYTYEGQEKTLPAQLKEWAAAAEPGAKGTVSNFIGNLLSPASRQNAKPVHDSFFPVVVPRATGVSLSLAGAVGAPVIDDVSNQWVVCSSLVTPRAIEKVDEDYRAIPRIRRSTRCREYPAIASSFDVTSKLARVTMPALFTGGSHDPLIPYALQQRDFEAVRAAGNTKASLVVIDKAGHNPDENITCFENAVTGFLAGKVSAGRVECDALTAAPSAPTQESSSAQGVETSLPPPSTRPIP